MHFSIHGVTKVICYGLSGRDIALLSKMHPAVEWIPSPLLFKKIVLENIIKRTPQPIAICVKGDDEPRWLYDITIRYCVRVFRFIPNFMDEVVAELSGPYSSRLSLLETEGYSHYVGGGHSSLVLHIDNARYNERELADAARYLQTFIEIVGVQCDIDSSYLSSNYERYQIAIGEDYSSNRVRLGGELHTRTTYLSSVKKVCPSIPIHYVCTEDSNVPSLSQSRQSEHVEKQYGLMGLWNRLHDATSVSVLTSDLGFLCLLLGKEVTVHGTPFYGGFGLTKDCAHYRYERTNLVQLYGCKQKALAHLFRAVLMESVCLDPDDVDSSILVQFWMDMMAEGYDKNPHRSLVQ